MSLNKNVVKDLKNKVRELSFKDLSENDILRELKVIYYSNLKNKEISYNTYLNVTAYIVLLKSVKTFYQVR